MNASDFRRMRQYASTKFGDIAYVQKGKGTAVLFLHGLPLNGFQWRGVIDHLSIYRRCIAPDFMGLGYSRVSENQDLSPWTQADMLAALLNALAIDEVDIIANDSGGMIAQLFLSRYPNYVKTALLTNCDVHENSPPKALRPMLEAARSEQLADQFIAPHLSNSDFARSDKGIGGLCYTDPLNFTDEAIDYYLSPLVRSSVRKAQFHRLLVSTEPNPLPAIEPHLKRSTVPVRMVWGTGDIFFDPVWAQWLDQNLPQSRGVRYIEGAKLFFPEEMPEIIVQEATTLWGLPYRSGKTESAQIRPFYSMK